MKQSLAIPAALAALMISAPAMAAEDKSLGQQLDEKMGEIDKQLEAAMGALEQFVDDLPMYEAPEITPEGDIIIRKRRQSADPPGSQGVGDAEERQI